MNDSDKTSLPQRIARVIDQRELATPATPVLLMVSGGSDSTALAYLACDLRDANVLDDIAILHVNHKLRGHDAEDDARFAERLAALLDIPFYLHEIDVAQTAEDTGCNIEAQARRERYRAAAEVLEKRCAHAASGRVFTAHTADDRAESFYMRSIVGTGPGGFRAMRYRNGFVARPLLDETRDSLRSYIKARVDAGAPVVRDDNGALWREDATNAHTDRFRAYVRHEIIPPVRQWNDHAVEVLCRSMNLIADEDDMLDDMACDVERRCTQHIGDQDDAAAGFILLPEAGDEPRPLMRRVVYRLLSSMLPDDARIETASIEAVLDAFEDGKIRSGYVTNIQGNVAVSANKHGIRVEPMEDFRKRRKRI